MNKAETKPDKPTPEEVAALAYDIWQKGGCKPGTDLENWLQAEKQLDHRAVTAASQRELAKTSQQAAADESQGATGKLGNAETNHMRRATNARSQNLSSAQIPLRQT